jgi:hypothetical protein
MALRDTPQLSILIDSTSVQIPSAAAEMATLSRFGAAVPRSVIGALPLLKVLCRVVFFPWMFSINSR